MDKLVIRADAGGSLGTGHVMRMIALAQAYIDLGGRVTLLSVRCPEAIIQKVIGASVEFSLLNECALGSDSDLSQTLDFCNLYEASALVLDGYHFNEKYLEGFKENKKGLGLLAVDDYGHCSHWECDYVLNQNLGAENNHYSCSNDTRLFLGANYALLRSDLKQSLSEATESGAPYRKLIVTMGGADIDNVTSTVLSKLEYLDCQLVVKVLVGGANPHKSEIKRLAKESNHKIELLDNVDDMSSLYLWADSIISAGGSTCWEWLAFGLHGAVITIAENQEPVVRELKNANLALCLGWPHQDQEADWATKISDWLQVNKLSGFGVNRSVIDGYGADRVAGCLMSHGMWLRPANINDAKQYFDWANDELVRKSGFSTEKIDWEGHIQWMAKKISEPTTQMFIYFTDQTPVGQVRFTQEAGEYIGCLEIGISISSAFRGKGKGLSIVKLAQKELINKKGAQKGIIARVKHQNSASASLFLKLGYVEQAEDPELGCRVFKLDI